MKDLSRMSRRQIVNELIKKSQLAWEVYVKLPTPENREKFEQIDDELRVELEYDRDNEHCDDNGNYIGRPYDSVFNYQGAR